MTSHLRILVFFSLLGCAERSILSSEDYGAEEPQSMADSGWGDFASEAGDTGWGDSLGSEVEDDFLKLTPAVTNTYVFVANPNRGTVTRVNVPTLDVITVEVGVDPAVVHTTSDYGRAVVFNKGSDDLSIIDAETLEISTVPVLENLNQMIVSPDGAWAICYHDAEGEDEDVTGGVQSYNQISLVNLETLEHHPMVVGSNPHQVKFSQDTSRALIVADDYLAQLELTADPPERYMIALAEDPLDPPSAEEVLISDNNSYAFVRQLDSAELVILDLDTQTLGRIPLEGNLTDLDLSPTGESAVVISRSSNTLLIFDTTAPFLAPQIIPMPEDETIGSISFTSDGSKAILYTTASPIPRYTIWEPDEGSFQTLPLYKPIQGVSITPTGDNLMIFHTDEDVEETPERYLGKNLLTLVELESTLPNVLELHAPPSGYVHSDTGEVGYFIMEGWQSLVMLNYQTLIPSETSIKSNPGHVGVLPGSNDAYVNQEHDLGRLTFMDPQDLQDPNDDIVETITGFELNSGIEH